MKKIFALIVFIVCIYFLGTPAVFAQQTQDPNQDEVDTPDIIHTKGQTTHQIELGQSESLIAGFTAEHLPVWLQSIVFSWVGKFEPTGDKFPIPDLTKYANWFTNAGSSFTTGKMQLMWEHDTTQQSIQGGSHLCVYAIDGTGGGVIASAKSKDKYEMVAPWIPPLAEYATLYNGLIGRRTLPDLKFKEPQIKLAGPKLNPCGSTYHSEDQKNVIVDSVGQNTINGDSQSSAQDKSFAQSGMRFVFAVTDALIALAKGEDKTVSQRAVDYITHLVPNAEKITGNIGPLTEADLDVAAIPDEQKKDLVKTQGFIQAYLTGKEQDFGETTGDAPSSYDETITGKTHTVNARFYLTSEAKKVADKFECKITPGEIQRQRGICITPSPSPAVGNCPIEQIAAGTYKPTNADSACGMGCPNDAKKYMSPTEAAAMGNLSPLAIKILVAAGQTFHVPASVLLGTMLHEGAFSHGSTWKWSSDEDIKKYSDCKSADPMPECRTLVSGNHAVGPFGFLLTPSDWNNPSVQGAVFTAFPTRPKGTLSPCNFVDAAFAAARALGVDDSHNRIGAPASCPATGLFPALNVYQGTDPVSSCASWTAERVALARYQYADRQCNDNLGRMVAIYKAASCNK